MPMSEGLSRQAILLIGEKEKLQGLEIPAVDLAGRPIVDVVIGVVASANQEVLATMDVVGEVESPLKDEYYQALGERMDAGVRVRRLGFGTAESVAKFFQQRPIQHPNYNFSFVSDIALYQRMILVDRNRLFCNIGGTFRTTDDPQIIDQFVSYFNYASAIASKFSTE